MLCRCWSSCESLVTSTSSTCCFVLFYFYFWVYIVDTCVCVGPEDGVGGIRLYRRAYIYNKSKRGKAPSLSCMWTSRGKEDNDGRSSPGFLSRPKFLFLFLFSSFRSGKVHFGCNELDNGMWPFHYTFNFYVFQPYKCVNWPAPAASGLL
jgi:hypothetical protein